MFFLKSIYCRVFQGAFRMALPFLPYREPEIIRSCKELGAVLQKEKADSVLVVTDKGIRQNGLLQPVVDKKTWLDLPMRYQPYHNKLYEKLLHLFLK